MTKPKSLTLVRVERPKMDWKERFELDAEALAEGSHRIGLPMTPDQARTQAIVHWMRHGDLRPLALEIAEGRTLGHLIGRSLFDLIDEGRISVKQLRRGARKQPGLLARNAQMYLAYREARKSLGHDDALKAVAGDFGISPDTIRNAVEQMKQILAPPELKPDLIP